VTPGMFFPTDIIYRRTNQKCLSMTHSNANHCAI
jgi:hypothetical protein